MLRVGFAGCGIKIPLREREFAFFMTRGMRDSFKIDGGMRIEKRKIRRCGRMCCLFALFVGGDFVIL